MARFFNGSREFGLTLLLLFGAALVARAQTPIIDSITEGWRWIGSDPLTVGAYDPGLASWLIVDLPTHFSLGSEYLAGAAPDGSVETFLRERVPLCRLGDRLCR